MAQWTLQRVRGSFTWQWLSDSLPAERSTSGSISPLQQLSRFDEQFAAIPFLQAGCLRHDSLLPEIRPEGMQLKKDAMPFCVVFVLCYC